MAQGQSEQPDFIAASEAWASAKAKALHFADACEKAISESQRAQAEEREAWERLEYAAGRPSPKKAMACDASAKPYAPPAGYR